MARHRNVRNRRLSDDYDYDDVYGHSVEEDSCLSPSDSAQWIFDRSHNNQAISNYLEEHSNIEEETEDDIERSALAGLERRESLDIRSLKLDEENEARLMSSLDELRNILGDNISDTILAQTVIKHNFEFNKALDELLNSTSNQVPKVDADTGTSKLPIVVEETLFNVKLSDNDAVKVIKSKFEPKTVGIVKGFKISNYSASSSRSETPREQSPVPEKISKTVIDDNKISVKAKENKVDPKLQYSKERGEEKDHLYLIVIGHVDAGKSTLMGRLLCDLGEVSQRTLHKYEQESKKLGKQSFMYAWVLDETGEERNRGITMDVGKAQFETKTKKVIILDAPGHADFIPNMITGAGQADVALLVVDATRGEFESGFELGGQTREHALLVRSLGINQLAVVVNKLDTSNWSEDRFKEIEKKLKSFLKQAGYKDSDVVFVPCSGLTGENLIKPSSNVELLKWYNGTYLLDVIDKFKVPERLVDKPLRMSINDIFKGTGSGFCVAGRIENGVLNKGDKVLLCPTKELAEVKGIAINDMSCNSAFAGDQVSVTLSGIDIQNVTVGFILSDPIQQVPVTSKFEARLVVFNVKIPITNGFPVLLHHQALVESSNITKLKALLNKSTGEVLKKKPRCLGNNSVALVNIEVCRPICIELYKDVKELGRITLRVGGVTIAAGLVTNIYNV